MNRSALVAGSGLVAIAAVVAWLTAPPAVDAAVEGRSLVVDASTDFTARQIAAGDALSAATAPWALTAHLVPLIVVLVVGLSPLGARLGGAVKRAVGGRTSIAAVLMAIGTVGGLMLLAAPFQWKVRQARVDAGLVSQSALGWLRDLTVSIAVTGAVAAVFVAIVAVAMRRWGVRWWIVASLCAGAGVLLLTFLQPVVIEPLFNRFTPMADGPLRSSLIDLAASEGVHVDDVLVADASRRTTTLNAYVSGWGSSRRIVLYDTLLSRASDGEIRSVVAHEVAHARQDDVPRAALLGAIGAAGAIALVAALLSTGVPARRNGSSLEQGGDEQPVPLAESVLLAAAVLMLCASLATPFANTLSRRVEARADTQALAATRDPESFAQLQHRLAVTARSDVTPSVPLHFWFGTHPTAPERIALARAWSEAHDGPAVPPMAGSRAR